MLWKFLVELIAAAVILLFSVSVLADVSGRFFSDVYVPVKNRFAKPLTQLSSSFWLEWSQSDDSSPISARVVLEANAFDFNNAVVTSRGDSTHVEAAFREAFAGYSNEGFEIRLGRQIIPWGKSDGINPTDYLTAKNLAFLNHDSEVQRSGGAGVWSSWTPAEAPSWNFTAVANPYFPEGNFLIGPDVLPAGVTMKTAAKPEMTAENLETAAKLSFTGESWDVSLSGFKGFNHFPEFTESSHTLAAPGVVLVDLSRVYRRQSAVGFDFSYSGEKWIYRIESAFIWSENHDGSNMLSTPSHHDTVAGVEHPIGDDFRIQAQIVYRYYPNYRALDTVTGADPVSAQVNREIAEANALLFQYQDRENTSTTIRFSYLKEPWDAEIFLIENWRGQDFLVRSKISYASTDQLRYTVGSDIYGGPGHRSLGALNSYNSVFAEAKYTF
jgi:hypothetical protein